MKITVNIASEPRKCLSQLGMFRDDQTWEAVCGPQEVLEAVGLLKQTGLEDVFMHFGN